MIETPHSHESGYALIDALVGVAIGSLIMLLVAGGLRQISAIDARLIEDARMRRDMLGLMTTLRQWVEPGRPISLPEGNQTPLLMRPLAGAATSTEWALGKLMIRPAYREQHQLEIQIAVPGSPDETMSLLTAPRIEFHVTNANHPFLTSFLGLSLQGSDRKELLALTIAQPRRARALCQAQPFHRDCLP